MAGMKRSCFCFQAQPDLSNLAWQVQARILSNVRQSQEGSESELRIRRLDRSADRQLKAAGLCEAIGQLSLLGKLGVRVRTSSMRG